MTDDARPMLYAIKWQSEGGDAQLAGVFSSLEIAKQQAQRRNRKVPLVWETLTTDSNHCKTIHQAVLTSWATQPAIEIWEFRLDAKHFR